jgi:hypothetical protein
LAVFGRYMSCERRKGRTRRIRVLGFTDRKENVVLRNGSGDYNVMICMLFWNSSVASCVKVLTGYSEAIRNLPALPYSIFSLMDRKSGLKLR